MEIQLKLYGASKALSDKEILSIELPNNSNIEKLRKILNIIITEKYLKNDNYRGYRFCRNGKIRNK